MLAVLPATKHVSFNVLQQWRARDVSLAEEHTTAALFPDCELGAIPPVGAAYGLKTIIDDDMLMDQDVWFEGGDHHTLVHMNAENWRRLQKGAGHFAFRSEEHTSELQSLMRISYDVFCLKKKTIKRQRYTERLEQMQTTHTA